MPSEEMVSIAINGGDYSWFEYINWIYFILLKVSRDKREVILKLLYLVHNNCYSASSIELEIIEVLSKYM